jgi:DNA-directed RNA polymerase subunit M/transcription elongation factor TFIIS
MSDSGDKKELKQITFRFCSECSNMLYPKEDEEARTLQFTCRTCQYTEEAKSSCVFRNVINNSQGERAGVTPDVVSDPTVGGLENPWSCAVLCMMCGLPIICSCCSNPSPSLGATDGPLNPTELSVFEFQLPLDQPADSGMRDVQISLRPATHRHAPDNSKRLEQLMIYDSDPFAEYDEEPESDMAASPTDEDFQATLSAF